MPKLLKIVIGTIMLQLIVSLFGLPSPSALFRVALSLGILAGFRTRSPIAWNFARLLAFLGIAGRILGIIAALFVAGAVSEIAAPAFWTMFTTVACVGIGLAAFQFIALGNHAIR